jgi:hypothetical protein
MAAYDCHESFYLASNVYRRMGYNNLEKKTRVSAMYLVRVPVVIEDISHMMSEFIQCTDLKKEEQNFCFEVCGLQIL